MPETLGLEEDVTYRLSKWDPNNRQTSGDPQYGNKAQEKNPYLLTELEAALRGGRRRGCLLRSEVDIHAKNVYGKEDTMITIQWDFALAEQFDMYYVDGTATKKRPYIIHRTSMGCYERTLAWLIEKYAGMFPTWLCPEQVRVLPISEKFEEYAGAV